MKHAHNNPATNFAMLLMALAMSLAFLACGKKLEEGSLTYEGQTYKTMKIGEQTWMAENLNYAVNKGVCYDPANCDKYGRVYTWASAMALSNLCDINKECASEIQPRHRGICPPGWYIPSEADWEQLISYAGGEDVAGKHLRAYGFAAKDSIQHWWSASEETTTQSRAMTMYIDQTNAFSSRKTKSNEISVRCIKDNEKNDEAVDKKIMTIKSEGKCYSELRMAGKSVATIDWGDSTILREKFDVSTEDFLAYRSYFANHQYANESSRTIKIAGENITALNVSMCKTSNLDVSKNTALTHLNVTGLSSLDLSKNTALTYVYLGPSDISNLDISKNTALTNLDIWDSKLSSLDLSKNTALTYVRISGNKLTDKALNALFKTLHGNAGEKTIDIGDNPGANDCDRSIAIKKGWDVIPEKVAKIPGLSGCFGFADESEKRLLTCADKGFNIALGRGKIAAEIKFSKQQKEKLEATTHRQTSNNFNNLEGYVYEVTEGNLKGDFTYFLSKKEWFENSLIPLKETDGDGRYNKGQVDAKTIKQIETLKKRKVKYGTLLAETEAGAKICLFVFEREGDDMLASIVYVDNNKTIVKDYPATYDDVSTWRADAGDDPGEFTIEFLAKTKEGLIMGVSWDAPEGQNSFILKEENGIFLGTEFGGGRYWSPF